LAGYRWTRRCFADECGKLAATLPLIKLKLIYVLLPVSTLVRLEVWAAYDRFTENYPDFAYG